MKITEAQLEVLSAMSGLSQYMLLEDVLEVSARTKSSLRGLINRLVKLGYVSETKRGYRVLKKGKVVLGASEARDNIEKALSKMSVSEIEKMHDDSLSHFTGLLMRAKTLPPKAVAQLSEVVKKHGITSEDEVGVVHWPETNMSLYDQVKNTGTVGEVREFLVEAVFDGELKKDSNWITGRVHVHSRDTYGNWNEVTFPTGLVLEENAMKKAKEVLDGKTNAPIRALIYGCLNWVKLHKGTGNPIIRCYDFQEIT